MKVKEAYCADYEQACSYIETALSMRRQAHRHRRIWKVSGLKRDHSTFLALMHGGMVYVKMAQQRMNKGK
jgi:hypothetical protein